MVERRKKRVLVVDDEADIRELLDLTLVSMGLEADCAATLAEAHTLLKTRRYRLCLTDMRLPDGEGIDLVRHIGESCVDLPVAVITAYGSMENAVSALKAGAFDYLAKPVALDQLRTLIKSALDLPQDAAEGRATQGMALLGESQAIVEVRGMIERVARSQAPVHIGGESGSGKELAARLIHQLSARQKGAFVPVNCGAIPENLMESEFFGYRKGAFTGADCDRDGFFQTANGGTLFLDEVADLPLLMQVKLLRAIQERRVRKIGSPNEETADVRVISATHQRLKDMVDAGRFRQDLFYRLNVIEVNMPALRDCREDISLLSTTILEKLSHASGLGPPKLSSSALRSLTEYPFPGNVRELENILERAIALLQGDVIHASDLHLSPAVAETGAVAERASSLQDHLDSVEKMAILEALQKTRFNRTAAAKLLGVTFRSLRYRMERLGLND
ncbi:MAG: sigma-54 dependent transcriptional regulator [Georgfuchsia sp.]